MISYSFDSDFSHDKQDVYFQGKKIAGFKGESIVVDPVEFREVPGNALKKAFQSGYYTDGNIVLAKRFDGYRVHYFKGLRNADAKSFAIIEGTLYARDNHQAYYLDKVIKTKYIENFVSFNHFLQYNNEEFNSKVFYAMDGENIYYAGVKIVGADTASFELMNSDYSRDKNNVYFQRKVIKDCDPQTAMVDKRKHGEMHSLSGLGEAPPVVHWNDKKFHNITDKNGVWHHEKPIEFSERLLKEWKGFFHYYRNLTGYWWHEKGGLSLPEDGMDLHYKKINCDNPLH